MRLLILSDLHLECGASLTLPPRLAYDAVVLAGDIHSPGHKAVHWAQRDATFGGRPVVFVAGNHEFYGSELSGERAQMLKVAGGSNVHMLDRESVVIGGVRFCGCTLWTDFRLPTRQPGGTTAINVAHALADANRNLNDFRLIEVQAPAKRQYRERAFRRLLQAEDTLAMHWVDRDWLLRELKKPFDGDTVVVTHHAPARGSVVARYEGDALTPAFVSDLPGEMFQAPILWVHGHTHASADYQRGACRVVSNPRGYRLIDGGFENKSFDAGRIVEVGVQPKPVRVLDDSACAPRTAPGQSEPAVRKDFYLKHSMSCLPDQSIGVEVDEARQEVRLSIKTFDSSLIAWLVKDILPAEHGVNALRDDNQITQAWMTQPCAYRLVVELAGVPYKAQVVHLFGREEVAVTLEPDCRPDLAPGKRTPC